MALNEALIPDKDFVLSKFQAGGVHLPEWAYAREVAEWVNLLMERDNSIAGSVEVHTGFTESAYRYVFAYKDMYKNKFKEGGPRLLTILPAGTRENDEPVAHNEEAGLIAYTYKQTMKPDLASTQTDASAFVWKRNDGTYAVVQTWPVEINEKFRKTFEEQNFPDPNIFNQDAMEEFKMSMIKLFDLPANNPDMPLLSVKKKTENNLPVYVGKGKALMSMLRTRADIRAQLDITKLEEPDGFECQWKCDGRTGPKSWKFDLTLDYCLYTKLGWDTMACVKPKSQFDKDCVANEEGKSCLICKSDKDDNIKPFVMDLDWFAPEAYWWTFKSTLFVWSCAILTVLLRWYGTALGWHWINNGLVLLVTTGMASLYTVHADFSAMKWCVVPWLQDVGKLTILGQEVSFQSFMLFQLFNTVLQTLTIQTSAWFMVTAVQTNDEVLEVWAFLWENSMFKFMPPSTWRVTITPKWVAIVLWCLSLGQLILPLLRSVPWEGHTKSFPAKDAGRMRVVEESPHKLEGAKEQGFVPEDYYHDFMTYWSKMIEVFFEMRGFDVRKSTYSHCVANLSLASGLCYTGSMSISHQQRRISQIIEGRQGFKFNTESGLEPLDRGWEMRAAKAFQRLGSARYNRITYIMFYKQALQMNLQITLVIITRIRLMQQRDDAGLIGIDVAGFISIMSLLYNFSTELYDVYKVGRIFRNVRKAVKETALKLAGKCAPYAHDDFYDEEGSIQRISYHGNDLKREYFAAERTYWDLNYLSIFCVWLTGYALIKFFFAFVCPGGAWELQKGCLNPSVNQTNLQG